MAPSTTTPDQTPSPRRLTQKTQPWLSHRPDMKKSANNTLENDYGFKKGERIVVPGSAGSLFAHGGWQIEKDSVKGGSA